MAKRRFARRIARVHVSPSEVTRHYRRLMSRSVFSSYVAVCLLTTAFAADACDKHSGQCCHHACKMMNWPCCHHGEHCCCGGPPRRTSNCSSDEYRPFQPFPTPVMPTPAPPVPGPPVTHCCFFANFTQCDSKPGESCETVPCIKGVTCPVDNTSSPQFSGHWCNAKVWHESCRLGWTHGCSCNVTDVTA